MVKTCYLHLGFHKTATTSFQLTLQHNRKLLEQGGIFLPKFEGKKRNFLAIIPAKFAIFLMKTPSFFGIVIITLNQLPINIQIPYITTAIA